MSILLKNVFDEIIDSGIDIDDSRYDSIMIFEISGDEVITAYDVKGHDVCTVDSDRHFRSMNFYHDYYFIKYAGKPTEQYNKFCQRRFADVVEAETEPGSECK